MNKSDIVTDVRLLKEIRKKFQTFTDSIDEILSYLILGQSSITDVLQAIKITAFLFDGELKEFKLQVENPEILEKLNEISQIAHYYQNDADVRLTAEVRLTKKRLKPVL